MASQQSGVIVLSPHVDLCPSPLHIKKRNRRTTTFSRRITRKLTSPRLVYANGPLDDIINEITGNIWTAPLEWSEALFRECESAPEALLTWQHPLKAPPTCTITALPVSRIPSDQPLRIRKNRNSRSSGSGSSMPLSRKSSRAQPPSEAPLVDADDLTAWPELEGLKSSGAQQALQETQSGSGRRSRLRLFTNGLSGLRRRTTGDTIGSNGPFKEKSSASGLTPHDEVGPGADSLAIDAVDAFMQKHARNGSKIESVITRAAERLPCSFEQRRDYEETEAMGDSEMIPSTLKAAVRILPETKLLQTAEHQEFWVGVELVGVMHNRHEFANPSIDFVFVIDNSYYVTTDCLFRALDSVVSALHHLKHGDRVALYTTHCAHNAVSGTVPDMMFPLRSFCGETEELLRELINDIGACGTQTLEPPRPNPTMSDVVLAVAKSLERDDIILGRTHMILLTPTTNVLHAVSDTFPHLYIHQLSPAVLPYRHSEDLQDRICQEPCCENVFVSNWAHQQTAQSCVKQIVRDARSENPIGKITNVHVDIRTKKGCEVVETEGTPEIGRLRLGQVHSFFVKIRVDTSDVQGVNLASTDPLFNTSLSDTVRQDLRNAQAVGATNAHLLSVQLVYQSSFQPANCWNYTEAQLVVTKDLGNLAPPPNTAMDLYKRHFFHRFSRLPLTADAIQMELDTLAVATPETFEELKQLVQRLAKERVAHEATLEYETTRPKFSTRPGPIDLDVTHEWLAEKWEAQKNKRKGSTFIGE